MMLGMAASSVSHDFHSRRPVSIRVRQICVAKKKRKKEKRRRLVIGEQDGTSG